MPTSNTIEKDVENADSSTLAVINRINEKKEIEKPAKISCYERFENWIWEDNHLYYEMMTS